MKDPISQLESVLCGPDGKCCILGSQADRDIIDSALAAPKQAQEPVDAELAKEVAALAEWHSKTSELWPIGMEQSSFHNKAAITLFAVLKPAPKQAQEPSQSEKTWCDYVAGMIGTYLNEPVESDKCKAISGIIERRLWALPTPPEVK